MFHKSPQTLEDKLEAEAKELDKLAQLKFTQGVGLVLDSTHHKKEAEAKRAEAQKIRDKKKPHNIQLVSLGGKTCTL